MVGTLLYLWSLNRFSTSSPGLIGRCVKTFTWGGPRPSRTIGRHQKAHHFDYMFHVKFRRSFNALRLQRMPRTSWSPPFIKFLKTGLKSAYFSKATFSLMPSYLFHTFQQLSHGYSRCSVQNQSDRGTEGLLIDFFINKTKALVETHPLSQ